MGRADLKHYTNCRNRYYPLTSKNPSHFAVTTWAYLILVGVLLGLVDHVLNLVLGQTARRLDNNVGLLAGALIASRNCTGEKIKQFGKR